MRRHAGVGALEDVDPLEAIREHGLHPLERLEIRIDHDQAGGRRRERRARPAIGAAAGTPRARRARAAAIASASRAASSGMAGSIPRGRGRLRTSPLGSSPLKTGSSSGSVRRSSSRALRAARSGRERGAGFALLVAQPRRLHRQVLGVDAGRQRELEVARLQLVAHFEAELTGAPGEHAQHGALDVLAPQRVDALGVEPGLAREHLVEPRPRARSPRSRAASKSAAATKPPPDEQGLQVLGLALHEGAAHLSIVQDDATLAGVGAQDEQAGLAGEAHDLKDVPESQVLEASHQAHSNPRQGRPPPRVSRAATGARRPLLHRLRGIGSASRAVT